MEKGEGRKAQREHRRWFRRGTEDGIGTDGGGGTLRNDMIMQIIMQMMPWWSCNVTWTHHILSRSKVCHLFERESVYSIKDTNSW